MDVVVTGIGLESCLGSLMSSWTNILAGKSGITRQQPFSELPAYPLGLIGKLENRAVSLSLLTEVVVQAAIKDAGLRLPLTDCAVVIGSSRGCQNIWEKLLETRNKQGEKGFDDLWLNSLPHQGAVSAARLIQTQGIVLSPMAACATGIHAIARGYELIQTGECQRVIVGSIETPITPLSLAGFAQMGALAKTGCYPFDRDREGLVLAEGGAALVLESAELAYSRNAKIYGRILGFGLTCDASHIAAPPDANFRSAAIAVKCCLERSNLTPDAINYIHAHGTSTQLNDAHEAKLIEYLFPRFVAVSSTKGATGHTLGASGAMGVVWCLLALQSGYLPPCVGLQELDFPLNLVQRAQQVQINYALCFAFGFGGQNAVIAVGK